VRIKRTHADYLRDMVEYAQKAERFVQGMGLSDFQKQRCPMGQTFCYLFSLIATEGSDSKRFDPFSRRFNIFLSVLQSATELYETVIV